MNLNNNCPRCGFPGLLLTAFDQSKNIKIWKCVNPKCGKTTMQKEGVPLKRSKYHAQKKTVDGIKFDSIKEATRYIALKLLEKHGRISSLRLQVPFSLSPAIYFDYLSNSFTFEKQSGKHGFCMQRATKYIADFVYIENGEKIIEDCKGFRTNSYKKKKNQMQKLYKIHILES